MNFLQTLKENFHYLILVVTIVITGIVVFLVANYPERVDIKLDKVEEVYLDEADYIDSVYNKLTPEERKGMMMMVGIPDTVLTQSTISFLKDNHIGGVILLGYNIESEEQLKQLTSDLRAKVDKDILIAIDQEGGLVTRVPWDQYGDISARQLGNSNDLDRAYDIAKYRGELLKELGIDITFGPVADIGYTQSDFIFDRSFGSSPEIVAQFVEATVRGYKDAGIISAVKHFPGHGRTEVDSHTELPTIDLSRNILESEEWIPFTAGIDAGVEMVMTAHIINPNIVDAPASVSPQYKDILEELGFKGVIITDDLNMAGGIEGNINYGINLTLEPQEKVVERINELEPDEEYLKRIIELRTR